MFLIRTAFWLSLVVLMLPTDARQQERLYQSASAAVQHASTFCERNADLCARGAEHWATFRQKLDFGARMAFDIASERLSGKPREAAPTQPTSGSLKPEDMQPACRGKGKVGA
jgi:hypothetical protein